jgi:two-component system cell cycle sensor histidine kinase/response regulator CckA
VSPQRTARRAVIVAFSATTAIFIALAILLYIGGLQFSTGRRAEVDAARPRLQIHVSAGDTKIFALMAVVLALVLVALAIWLAVRDLAERKAASLARSEAEAKYRQIFEQSPVGIFQSTPAGQLLSANPALARIIGYASPEEMVADRTDLARQGFLQPSERDDFVAQLAEKGELLNFEHECSRTDGTTIWVSEDVRCVRDDAGQPRLYEGILTDITQRVLAERALRESEEKYRLLFQANPQPMWAFDLESLRFLAVNQTAVRNYGYSRQEFLQMTLRDIRPTEDLAVLMESVADKNQLVRRGVFRHQKKDGTVIHVEISEDRIVFDGKPAGLVVAVDVSERLKLEQQLLQIQKIEAVGQLAGGVAHDFNNLVMVIQSYCDLLTSRTADERSQKYVGQIKTAAQRATAITQQLLAFSRKQVLAPKVINVNEVLTQSLSMLRRLIGEHVRFIVKPDAALWFINADPVQIEQVVMNLAVNARDAMPKGGSLTIETANVELDEQYCSSHYPVEPGRYVMLAVTDTGEGMNAATQAKIFEPFFTTKDLGKGTGLGLATVYGIVKQSGGYIWVYSELGHGTIFKLYFPRIALRLAETAAGPVPTETAPRGSGTILLVEDEEALAQVEVEFLQATGFDVLAASNGIDALKIAHDFKGTIVLIVTDVVLPGMSGKQLADKIRIARPETKVLFMSGYAADTALLADISAGEPFLQKPFTLSALGKAIHKALNT